jgi:hypothetical protein
MDKNESSEQFTWKEHLFAPALASLFTSALVGLVVWLVVPHWEEEKLSKTEGWKMRQTALAKAMILATQSLESAKLKDPEQKEIVPYVTKVPPTAHEINIIYCELLASCKNTEVPKLFLSCFAVYGEVTVKNWGDFINAARKELRFEALSQEELKRTKFVVTKKPPNTMSAP